MVAWCTKGTSYSAKTRVAALATAAIPSPMVCATTPERSASATSWARMLRIERARLPFVHLDYESAPRLNRWPIRVRHDGDAGGAPCRPAAALGAHPRAGLELHHVAHPGHRLRAVGIEALHPAAQHRRPLDRGDEHLRHLHIDAEHGAPVHLARRVEPSHPRADPPKVLRIPE